MNPFPRPEAIDTRLVFRAYAWTAIAFGLAVYAWPASFVDGIATRPDFDGISWGRFAIVRLAGGAVVVFGIAAAGFGSILEPVSSRRALYWFAWTHFVAGLLFLIQWLAILEGVVDAWVAWTPFLVGLVLLHLAITAPSLERMRRTFILLGPSDRHGDRHRLVDMKMEALESLRSQYEDQIRQATRREERARLARDLHDAVKQQLFVIQTAAATAQARQGSDDRGLRAALEEVRVAAREATSEMAALIDELQAAPMGQTGLVEALKKQCEALGFRTGAHVAFDAGALPPDTALQPGAHNLLFRTAQEALANVGRHARAQHVTVSLGMAGDRLELEIRDDGAGFNPVEVKHGMGLRNMSARALELAGTLTINSAPGAGTTVRLAVPCQIESAGAYARKAFWWSAALVPIVAMWFVDRVGHWPSHIAVAAIVAITAGRYLAAYHRVRRIAGAHS